MPHCLLKFVLLNRNLTSDEGGILILGYILFLVNQNESEFWKKKRRKKEENSSMVREQYIIAQ